MFFLMINFRIKEEKFVKLKEVGPKGIIIIFISITVERRRKHKSLCSLLCDYNYYFYNLKKTKVTKEKVIHAFLLSIIIAYMTTRRECHS